jgi:hypothetical protein
LKWIICQAEFISASQLSNWIAKVAILKRTRRFGTVRQTFVVCHAAFSSPS